MSDAQFADSDFKGPLTDRDLGLLQLSTVLYYLRETNPDNGLVRDKTDPAAPVSIAAKSNLLLLTVSLYSVQK